MTTYKAVFTGINGNEQPDEIRVTQDSIETDLVFDCYNGDGTPYVFEVGDVVTGSFVNKASRIGYGISGTITPTIAGSTMSWARSDADVGAGGNYEITFKVVSLIPKRDNTVVADYIILPIANGSGTLPSPLVGVSVADSTWLTIQTANGEDVGDKADKDAGAVVGNLAEFDAGGNPVDSGSAAGDFDAAGSAAAAQAASVSLATGGTVLSQIKIEKEFTFGDLATIPLRIEANGIAGDIAPWPLLELHNPDPNSGGEYEGEAKMFMRAGNGQNQRRYIHFRRYDNGDDDWIWGVNASDVRIEYDKQAAVHRSWLEQGGDSCYAAAGGGFLRLNYHPTDTVGTSGVSMHSGGAPADSIQIGLFRTTSGPDSQATFFMNSGKAAAQNLYIDFSDRGTSKFFMGKHNSNAWALYDSDAASYLMWNTGGNVGLFGVGSFGGGKGVAGIKDAATVPTSNPAGGGILYSEGGALKWRGSSGTITTLGAA